MSLALRNLSFGNTPVPYTVSWSGEEGQFLATCPHFKAIALSQRQTPGVGKPEFGTPHSCRQREAIAAKLCDICGASLATSTKVSLSQAKAYPHGAQGWAILQVEPLLHRRCAATAIRFCPSLKTQLADGSLHIRQVHRWRAQCAVMTPEYVSLETGETRKALGHAKVELIQWTDRDLAWLEAA